MCDDSPLVAVVDDEEPVRKALLRLLRSANIAAVGYGSAAELFESLRVREPDCVVLDLHMPGFPGLDAQSRLNLRWPAIPVIVITGHHSDATQERALDARPVAYLQKPMNDQLLLDAIEVALQRRAQMLRDGGEHRPQH